MSNGIGRRAWTFAQEMAAHTVSGINAIGGWIGEHPLAATLAAISAGLAWAGVLR